MASEMIVPPLCDPLAWLLIKIKYRGAKTQPSDIYEHIPTLYRYAKECESIIECGVRSCVSTWAFAKGLCRNGAQEKRELVSIDLDQHPNMIKAEEILKQTLTFQFWKGNDLNFPLEREYDLVFIDTWHVAGQCQRELEKFAPFVRKYIILHDTEIDWDVGESIREHFDIGRQMKETGFTWEEITTGLGSAIMGFLANHPEFVVEEKFPNCNGLMVLARVSR